MSTKSTSTETIEKINKAIEKLIFHIPEIAYITSYWDIEENNSIQTMGTDYKRLLFNKSFVDSLKKEELAGVILHEALHCLFLHPTEISRMQEKGKIIELWRIAEEIVVNAVLISITSDDTKNSICLPGEPYPILSSYFCIKGRHYNFYDDIPEIEQNKNYYFYDSAGESHTTYEIYEKLIKKYEKNNIFSKKHLTANDIEKTAKEKFPLYGDAIETKTTNNDAQLQEIEMIEKANVIIHKLSQKGNLPSSLERFYKKIYNDRIPVERILQHFVITSVNMGNDDITWSRLNTRHHLADKILLPGEVVKEYKTPIIAIDTSGSISNEQFSSFMAKIRKIKQYINTVTVVTIDADIQETVKIRNIEEVFRKIKFKGGGGTNFQPFFNKFKKADFVIFFTDGCAYYPDTPPKYPVLWILTKENQKPPFGKVVYICEE